MARQNVLFIFAPASWSAVLCAALAWRRTAGTAIPTLAILPHRFVLLPRTLSSN